MEEHHHPELPHRESKNLEECLLEGLMIFSAVFMRLVAENMHKHMAIEQPLENLKQIPRFIKWRILTNA